MEFSLLSSTESESEPQARPPRARRIKLWHFVALPAAGMALMIALGRILESVFVNRLEQQGFDLFGASRTVLITIVMASLVGWMGVRYRRQYEAEIGLRNKQLVKTRDFLSSVIEGSGEAIITLDSDGRVSSWNRAAEQIFGWSAEEMIGATFRRLLPDDPLVVEERNRVGRLVKSGKTVRDFQTTRLRKDGARITVRITWAPLHNQAGEFEGTVGIVLDVTAESEMKQRLVEHERLAAVGEMAAQVAHEVRNPLAGIRGACEMVLHCNLAPEMREEVGQEVVQQIDRLNRTVEELLQFAHPRIVERTQTDLEGLINRVLSVLKEDPWAESIEFVRDFSENLPQVNLDPARIEQVLYNLLLNAAQMMTDGGTITISTGLEQGMATVMVQDTGPGIPEEVGRDIFKPFVTTRTSGTGLGLAIVKKIIEAHQGSIEAYSRAEGGAEFRIRLPLQPTPAFKPLA
jgi:PAS domain S-box-containing protein